MFEEKHITRKTNLQLNDSLSSYNNWAAQQHYNVFAKFYGLIDLVKPSQILEIGTALGGFTQFLDHVCRDLNLKCDILSYDIIEQSWYKYIKSDTLDIRVENIFDNEYSNVSQSVIEFIQRSGVTMVLCDGGNKQKEFNLLSRFIKQNDIIMAHDYAPNKDYFNHYINNVIWNWHEIEDLDIEEACAINNLQPYLQDELIPVVWVCRRKA